MYGSVARGDNQEDSNIDILIISDNFEDKVADEVINVISNNNEYLSTRIMSKEHFEKTKKFSFLTNVLKECVLIG